MSDPLSETITSVQNPRVKRALQLRNARERRRSGNFLIDGEREITAAIRAGVKISTLFSTAELPVPTEWGATRERIQWVSERVMEKLSYGDREHLPVAVAQTPDHSLQQLRMTENCLILVLDRIEKPGNLGACLRTAIACGVDAVVLNSPVCELYNPNTIRASRGAVFETRVAITTTSQLLEMAKERNIQLFAARVDGVQRLWECDLSGPTAVVFGSEADGLGEDWVADPVTSFKIPMDGNAAVDSLNVSISAAVTLYEAVRQRRFG